MEEPELIDYHDRCRAHDARAALACGDDFKTASRFRGAGEGRPLRLEGLADHLILAETPPGEHAGGERTLEFVVRLEDQHRPASGHMPEANSYQRRRFSRLHRSADRDLFEGVVVHRVQHVAPGR